MTTPLAGIRVVELGTMITAPLAGMMLADLGAEVTKVERPEGDPFRYFAGMNYSPHFAAFNRNKRSVVIDLQTAAGIAELRSLLREADVLLDNMRPGVLDRLGFAASVLEELNANLVHCSITGFGSRGPYAARPAFDTVGQALSGITGLAVDPEHPLLAGITASDNVAGMYACYAIMAGLMNRPRVGRGCRLEVNMLEASMAFMPDSFLNLDMLGLENGPYTRVAFSQAYVFRCRDGRLLAVHLSSPDKFWRQFVAVLGRPALLDDARFGSRDLRTQHYAALRDLLQEAIGERDRTEWVRLLEQVDVPFAPVQSISEVTQDRHVQSVGILREMELPDGRVAHAVQAPVMWDGARLPTWRRAPTLGEDAAGTEGQSTA